MNTTVDPNLSHLGQLLSSISQSNSLNVAIIVIAIVVTLILLIVLIFFFVKIERKTNKFYRLLFRFATNMDSSPSSIASPDNRGHFRPPVWCQTCNAHVDHVTNLCPHIGKKLYASSMQRRFYDYWHRQLLCRSRTMYHTVHRPATNIANTNAAPNITIDLDELIGHNKHSVDRRPSQASLLSNEPFEASTPNSDRFESRIQRKETRLARIRSKMQLLANRRRVSNASSGMGSSIESVEEKEECRDRSTLLKRLVAKPRRWMSDLAGTRRPSANTQLPLVVVHRCSTRRHKTMAEEHAASQKHLRVSVSWNGSQANGIDHRPMIRRAYSSPCDDCQQTSMVRSASSVSSLIHFPTSTLRQQPDIDAPVIVHASVDGNDYERSPKRADPVSSQESSNCSFSDYL